MKLEKYINRTSVRDWKNSDFNNEDIELISKVINNSPTSTNTQQFSAIIIKDEKLKNQIGEWNYNQEHIKKAGIFILFVADRSKIKYILGDKFEDIKDVSISEFVRSYQDATIATTYAMNALMELGYGSTMVGGIRSVAKKISKLLDLPDTVYPVLGLSVGNPSGHVVKKPKMNKVFINKYNLKQSHDDLDKYNIESKNTFAELGLGTFKEQIERANSVGKTYFESFKEANINLKKIIDNFK